MKLKNIKRFLIIMFFSIVLPCIASDVPMQIDYHGFLKDNTGKPITNTHNITFTIHDAESEGNIIWSETHGNVDVNDGVFSFVIGESHSLTYNVFKGERYYSLKIDDGLEMEPRRKFVSVGTAIRAGIADSVENGAIKAYMIADNTITGNKIADQSISANKLKIDGIFNEIIKSAGQNSGFDADMLDGKHASAFALKGDVLTIEEDGNVTLGGIVSIREIKPDLFPDAMQFYGKIYAKSPGIDTTSKSSLLNNLIMYWKMDELAGETTIYDDVSSLNNGTAISAESVSDGRLGRARYIDGLKTQTIIKEHDSKIDFGYGDFSISFWMKAKKPLDWTVIISKASNRSDRNEDYGWFFGNTSLPDGDGIEFSINSGGTGNKNNKTVTAPKVFDDNWHHIVGVKNGETISIFVDGELKSSLEGVKQSVSSIPPKSIDEPMIIGTVKDPENKYYYTGYFDELAIWDRALSASEISDFYKNNCYEGLPHSDGGLYYLRSDGKEFDLTETDNRYEVFRHNTGTFSLSTSTSEWGYCNGITGTTNVDILKPVAWQLDLSGHNINSSTGKMNFRLEFKNSQTKSIYYLPDKNGTRLYMKQDYSLYTPFTMTGISKLPKGPYEVKLQVIGSGSYNYSWNSEYGHIVLNLW